MENVAWQETTSFLFPIYYIYQTDKKFGLVHNSDDEAELEKSGRIIDLDEFYVYYKGPECTYGECYAVVLKLFVRNSRYNEEEAGKIMEREKEFLRKSFEGYVTGQRFCSPGYVEKYLFI